MAAQEVHALVVAWSFDEGDRLGEVALLPGPEAVMLGRGTGRAKGVIPRLTFLQQRPAKNLETGPLRGKGISREHVRLEPRADGVAFERLGQTATLVNGQALDAGTVRPGDTLSIEDQLVLFCTRRPTVMPPLRSFPDRLEFPFGRADPFGHVGESPRLWALRDNIAFHAPGDEHVLIFGASGTGKELVARTLHALSRRSKRLMISRNAATLPSALIDAELFGNARSYPNAGMPERPGLIGEASGGALFLDEIGEATPELQAHLLRVMDGGEYTRLGDATPRRADLRIFAATNREPWELKHDFAARLPARIVTLRLQEHRDDIPLIVRHLLALAAARSPESFRRFVPEGSVDPRVDPRLIELALHHPWPLNVRDLDGLLTRAAAGSAVDLIECPPEQAVRPEPASERPEPSREEIAACLTKHGGNQSRTWRELGLKNRFVFYRLLKKHGLAATEPTEGDED